MDSNFLKNYRKQIDRVDKEILFLIKRRFQLAKKIAKYKMENELPVHDEDREDEVLKNVTGQGKLMEFSESFIRRMFELILSESNKEQEAFVEKKEKRMHK
jgi:monofunctional chorismate mutase